MRAYRGRGKWDDSGMDPAVRCRLSFRNWSKPYFKAADAQWTLSASITRSPKGHQNTRRISWRFTSTFVKS